MQRQQSAAIGQIGQGVEQIQNIADQSRTEGGRFGLLRQAFGNPRYSAGQRRLDQLMLQGGGNLANLQQNLGQMAQTEQQGLQDLQEQFQQDLSDIETQAGTAQEQLTSALGGFGAEGGGRLGQLYGALEGQREAERLAQDERFNQLRENVSAGRLGQEEMELLGLAPETRTFNVDLSRFAGDIARGDTNVSQADVITDEQRNKLNALTQLAGLGTADQAVNLGEVRGTPGVVFDDRDLRSQLAGAQQRFDDFINQTFRETTTRKHKKSPFGGQKKSYGHAEATGQQLLDMLRGGGADQVLLSGSGHDARGTGKQRRQSRDRLLSNFERELQRLGYDNMAGVANNTFNVS